MEKERLTDKEVHRIKNAKQIFMEYFSAENIGHAVDTLQVTETHTNSSATLPIRIDNTAVDVSIGWREGVATTFT